MHGAAPQHRLNSTSIHVHTIMYPILYYLPGERKRLSLEVYWQACRTQVLAWQSSRHLQDYTVSKCGLAGERGAVSAQGG